MEFVVEPWHWFVLGILLILSELIIPAFAALWFGIQPLWFAFSIGYFQVLALQPKLYCGLFYRCYAPFFGSNLLNPYRLIELKQVYLVRPPLDKLVW